MNANQINSNSQLQTLVVNTLKEFGIKLKDKKCKISQNKSFAQRLFRNPLHLLPLTDAFLANGVVVQVPKFVADACSCVLEQVEVEGIFRKAGSAIKQKEIRKNLEAGLPLGKSHRVIDVANIISYFFRELPEPLIPYCIHETIIQCLLLDSKHVEAILLSCLLLSPLVINTIAYFMQFLHTVSSYSNINKMCAENLAIVFAPGIMPHTNINSARFKNHIKVVQILIENANDIGRIPTSISNKVRNNKLTIRSPLVLIQVPNTPSCPADVNKQKKKKRRSDMFNGLRKIVGSALGSSENLENERDARNNKKNYATDISNSEIQQPQQQCINCTTPFYNRTSKKRKYADSINAFSAKKKEMKKSRISLEGNQYCKAENIKSLVATTERRWSLVSTGWTKQKKKDISDRSMSSNTSCTYPESSVCASEPNADFDQQNPVRKYTTNVQLNESDNFDCINVSRNKNEVIKERVATTGKCISKEFRSLRRSHSNHIFASKTNGPELVQTKFQKMFIKTEVLSSPVADQLTANQLNRGLKIRQSIEKRIIHSPSARKIGAIHICSQDQKECLSRTRSWHTGSTSTVSYKPIDTNLKEKLDVKLDKKQNTFEVTKESEISDFDLSDCNHNKEWTPAECFFKNPVENVGLKCSNIDEKLNFQTSDSYKLQMNFNSVNVPISMVPQMSIPRQTTATCCPALLDQEDQRNSMKSFSSRISTNTPVNEDTNGRASIARLRTQNAGMVMAKAKLFDKMSSRDKIHRDNKSIDMLNHVVQSNDKSIRTNLLRTSAQHIQYSNPNNMNMGRYNTESPNQRVKKIEAKNVLLQISNKKSRIRTEKEKFTNNLNISSPKTSKLRFQINSNLPSKSGFNHYSRSTLTAMHRNSPQINKTKLKSQARTY